MNILRGGNPTKKMIDPKLLKYDFKELLKICIPMYAFGLIAAILYNLIMNPLTNVVETLDTQFSMILSVVLVIVAQILMFGISLIIVGAIIWIIVDFYGTVFGKQGYLTHTLPVSKGEILWSKVISSTVMLGVTTIVSMVLSYVAEFRQMVFIDIGFPVSFPLEEGALYTYIAGSFLLFILVAQGVLTVFTSIALGHLTKYNKVMSFVFFHIINNVVGFLVLVPSLIYVLYNNMNYQNNAENFTVSLGHGIMLANVISLIMSCILGFITYKIMDKKLNLV